MSTVATWDHNGKGKKTFLVERHRIYTPTGLTTETTAKTVTKKNKTTYSGKELQTLSFSVEMGTATGTLDILNTERSWRNLITKVGTFKLGGKSLGATKFRLTKVGLSNISTDNEGTVRQATMSLEFEEYRKAKKKKKKSKSKASKSAKKVKKRTSTGKKTAKKKKSTKTSSLFGV